MRCENCGRGFQVRTTGRGGRNQKWCSRKCMIATRQRELRAVAVAAAGERRCVVCETPLPPETRLTAQTCSRKCSTAWQNQKRDERKRARWRAEPLFCQNPACGKQIPVPDSGYRRTKYCSPECKSRVQDARWRARSPHYMRQYLYGITQEQYEAMLVQQDHRCAICGSAEWPAAKDPGSPRVDHDRETGKVRGLLCDFCNRGIGMLRHDPARLRAAASYLERAQ